MRDYARVGPTFWTRGSGKKLRGNPLAQTIALYLFTCPSSTMSGLFYMPLPTLCHEVGCPFKGASKALRRVCEAGIALYDADSELVFLPEGARYQIGPTLKPGDKRRTGLLKALEPYRNHPFFNMFLERYREPYGLDWEPGNEAPSKGLASPFEAPSKPEAGSGAGTEAGAGAGGGKKRPHPMPDDFEPDETRRALAAELGLDCAAEVQHMREWTGAKGKTYLNWQLAFANHLRSEAKRNPPAASEGPHYSDEWKPGDLPPDPGAP